MTFGFDPGMKRRCVRTVDPTGPNGFSDMRDDDGTGRHYTLAFECEAVYGQSIGPLDQGLPIDGTALSFDWLTGMNGYTANLLMDLYHHPAPAPKAYNWYAFMDSTGTYGSTLDLATTLTLAADWWCPVGEARAFVTGGFWWDGVPHLMDINVGLSDHWGTTYPETDDILWAAPFGGGEYVSVDGRGWGLTIPKATVGTLTIDWGRAAATLCERWDRRNNKHFFTPPTDRRNVASGGVGVGMEVLTLQAERAAIAQLWCSGMTTSEVP